MTATIVSNVSNPTRSLEAPKSPVTERGRIPELDGLRGLAVLAVVAVHYTQGWAWPSWYLGLGFGWAGVDLFFVLSGFLITGILRRTRSRPDYYRHFYARRARRIFPIAGLLLGVYFVSVAWIGPIPWRLFAMYAGFMTSLIPSAWWISEGSSLPLWIGYGLGVMWTLSVEEWFYLLWAPAVRRWSDRQLGVICLGAIVAAPALRWTMHAPGIPESYFFLARFDGLAWGALTALAWAHFKTQLAATARVTATIGVVAIFIVWALTTHGDRNRLLFALVGYTVLDVGCAAVLLVALTNPDRRPWLWLRTPALCRAGVISYGLYLLHQPVYQLLGALSIGLTESRLIQGLLALAASLMLASLSWRYFESPILNRHLRINDPAPSLEP